MRRKFVAMVAVAILLVSSSALGESIHILKLIDGRILKGEFIRAENHTVWFRIADGTEVTTFPFADVVSIHLSSASPNATPAARQKPAAVTAPVGTAIRVRLEAAVGTVDSDAGGRFYAMLEEDIVLNGATIAARGHRVTGLVRKVVRPAHSDARAVIELVIADIPVSGKAVRVISDHLGVETERQAIAITGNARFVDASLPAMHDGRNVKIPAGTVIEFHLTQPMIVR